MTLQQYHYKSTKWRRLGDPSLLFLLLMIDISWNSTLIYPNFSIFYTLNVTFVLKRQPILTQKFFFSNSNNFRKRNYSNKVFRRLTTTITLGTGAAIQREVEFKSNQTLSHFLFRANNSSHERLASLSSKNLCLFVYYNT